MLRPFGSGSKMAASLRASSVEAVRTTKVLLVLPLTVILTDPKRCHAFPTECLVDATGLDGSDLRLPREADIVVRTDRHGQNVYGPSIFLSGESYHLSSIWTWACCNGNPEIVRSLCSLFLEQQLSRARLQDAVGSPLHPTHIAPSHRRYPHLACD